MTRTLISHQGRLLFGDEAVAVAFWRDKEWKKWAVDVTACPTKRPTLRTTYYARARTAENAITCVQRNMSIRPPRAARFTARLAGPSELGCVQTPAAERNPS